MGHAYSSIIADFFARFKKISGNDVYFLTGTDEHGQKIERAAKQNNKEPITFCDEISQNFKNLSKTLNLSNNDFIRTTETRHKKAVQHLWNILEKKVKYIYLNILDGIQFLMKLFIVKMKLKKSIILKSQNPLDHW